MTLARRDIQPPLQHHRKDGGDDVERHEHAEEDAEQGRERNGYARELEARGKRPGVVACALGHRANRVAFAMIRDQVPFDPERW